MVNQEQLVLNILRFLDVAVLRRVAPRQYEFLGKAPDFYNDFFPPTAQGPCNTPWEYSVMLEFFLEDAENFFNRGEEGEYSSGVWQEDGQTDAEAGMLAVASMHDGVEVVIIRLLNDDYRQRVGILRKAREQLLENRKLATTLKEFKAKSQRDGLTKILNRETFMEILRNKISAMQHKIMADEFVSEPPSLLMMDIDNFKNINDTYGHLCGDMVLQGLGQLLTDQLRRSDIVARYGGEEFVVLILRGTPEQVYKIADKVRAAIEANNFGWAPRITVSVGCATYIPGESVENFIHRADDAMYDAKHRGKNIVCVR